MTNKLLKNLRVLAPKENKDFIHMEAKTFSVGPTLITL